MILPRGTCSQTFQSKNMQREREREIEGTKETPFLLGRRMEERKMCDQVHISNLLFVSHEFKILVRDFRFRNCSFSFSSLLLDNIRNTKIKQSTIGCLQVSESTSLITHMSVQRESAAAASQSLATSSVGTLKNITTTDQIF